MNSGFNSTEELTPNFDSFNKRIRCGAFRKSLWDMNNLKQKIVGNPGNYNELAVV